MNRYCVSVVYIYTRWILLVFLSLTIDVRAFPYASRCNRIKIRNRKCHTEPIRRSKSKAKLKHLLWRIYEVIIIVCHTCMPYKMSKFFQNERNIFLKLVSWLRFCQFSTTFKLVFLLKLREKRYPSLGFPLYSSL